MTIAEMRERSNRVVSGIPKDFLVLLLVLSASVLAFGLGMLAEREMLQSPSNKGFKIEKMASTTAEAVSGGEGQVAGATALAGALEPLNSAPPSPTAPTTGQYVASKNGTKYYLPSCSGAKRIKPENRVWFATIEDAKASGKTPASNCPGL